MNEMKNSVIRINNKISVKSGNASNTVGSSSTNSHAVTNRNESEESLVNSKFQANSDASQQEEFLITSSCSKIYTGTNSPRSHMISSEQQLQRLAEDNNEVNVEIMSYSMDVNQNVSKIMDTEAEKESSPISNQNLTEGPYVRRSRNESIKQLTRRFRSFSIDVMRQIEMAHELVDLRNSNFVSATQSVAVQQYNAQNSSMDRSDYDPEYGADVSDDNTYLSPYYRSKRADTTTTNKNTTSEQIPEDDKAGILSENLPSTSTTIYDKSDNENNDTTMNVSNKKNILALNASNSAYLSAASLNTNSISGERPWSKKYSKRNMSMKQQERTLQEDDIQTPECNNIEIQISNHDAKDEVDYRIKKGKKGIPDDIHISILEVFIYLWGVITFFADFITDIILSIEYYKNQKAWLGSMTLIFVIVPNLTLSLFSLSWYIDKYYSTKPKPNPDDPNDADNKRSSFSCESVTFWVTTVFFVVFQLDLVWKYIQGFVYTVKGWACRSVYKNLQWEKYYIEKQIKCDTDIGMLRLIDVFMDSAPQVLLQLYVITTQNLEKSGSANLVVFTFKDFQTTSLEVKQFVSIVSSLFSMGYALAGYHRCLRNQQFIFCLEQNKTLPRPMSWFSTFMQFAWYLFLIAPRVLSMALFASTFRSWFFMIIFVHWLFMFFWILRLKTNYCITSQEVYSAREEIFEKFYDFVCSFIYIFCYFNLKSGPTRLRYLIYYIIFYSENLLFCICYFLFSKEINYVYKMSMLFIVVFGFWVAITFQIVYYLHCHPSHDIRVCVTKKKEFHFIHKKTLRKPTSYVSTSDDESEEEDNFRNRIKKFGKNKLHWNQTDETRSIDQKNVKSSQAKDKGNIELISKSISDIDRQSEAEQQKQNSPSILYLEESFDRIESPDLSLDRSKTAHQEILCKKRTSTSLKTLERVFIETHLTEKQQNRSFSLNTLSRISYDMEAIDSTKPPLVAEVLVLSDENDDNMDHKARPDFLF